MKHSERGIRHWLPAGVMVMALVAVTAACGDDGDDAEAPGQQATEDRGDAENAEDPEESPEGAESSGEDAAAPTGDLGDCPAGFDGDTPIEAGEHGGFASGGQDRSFHLLLPDGGAEWTERVPLFVSITGTVQDEVGFMEQSGIDRLPDDGWIVVAPVRNENGLVWGPWDAMRTPDETSPNPDTTFMLDLISCLSAHHPVDQDRVFAGGISIGGTMVNFLLRHHPEVFAGGIVGSGNFILTEPPEPEPLGDMTVIVAWGGEDDQWTGCPDGRMGEEYADEPGCVSADFVADAHAAAEFYADEGVRLLACQEDVGHIWIAHATPWWAEILAESPRGVTDPLEPEDAPDPLECTTDPPGG